MRIAERICIIIAVTGVIFKFLHWPGAGLMILLGISALAFIYFALGWLLFRPQKSKTMIPALAIPAGFALSTALIGILFKLQHWPGARINIAAGAFLSLIVIVPLSLWFMKRYRDHNEEYISQENKNNMLDAPETPVVIERSKYIYSKNVFKRAAVIGTLAAILYFLPFSAYNNMLYWDDPEYARLKTRCDEAPGNIDHQQELENYRARKFGYEPYNYKEGTYNENR